MSVMTVGYEGFVSELQGIDDDADTIEDKDSEHLHLMCT